MDLIYMTGSRIELGVLTGYEMDVDVAKDMDFELKASTSNVILETGWMWYVPDTEYGGVINGRTIDSKSKTITYSGVTWRGMLSKKIIEPPPGLAYLQVTGTFSGVAQSLFETAGITALFSVATCADTVSAYKFDRYTTLHDGLVKMAKSKGRSVHIAYTAGGIVVSFPEINDYSGDTEYSQDNGIDFTLAETRRTTNHLICLGPGELTNRTVIHLCIQADGSIGSTPYFIGLDEVVEKLDFPNAESTEELEASGRERLAEAAGGNKFAMSVQDRVLELGDIIGCRDRITGATFTAAVTNIIAKVKDNKLTLSYTVG